jgi:hypothetical protein
MNQIRKTVPELLQYIADSKGTKKEKQSILLGSVDNSIAELLELLYNKDYQFTKLKKFKFESSVPSGMGVRRLERFISAIKLLEDDSILRDDKRESKAAVLCESIDQEEVKFLLALFKGKSSIKGISTKFIYDTLASEI